MVRAIVSHVSSIIFSQLLFPVLSISLSLSLDLLFGGRGARTRREGSLELLSLVGVLENKGVEVLLAADLELDLLSSLVLLDPGGCWVKASLLEIRSVFATVFSQVGPQPNVPEASLRRQISMNCG